MCDRLLLYLVWCILIVVACITAAALFLTFIIHKIIERVKRNENRRRFGKHYK